MATEHTVSMEVDLRSREYSVPKQLDPPGAVKKRKRTKILPNQYGVCVQEQRRADGELSRPSAGRQAPQRGLKRLPINRDTAAPDWKVQRHVTIPNCRDFIESLFNAKLK